MSSTNSRFNSYSRLRDEEDEPEKSFLAYKIQNGCFIHTFVAIVILLLVLGGFALGMFCAVAFFCKVLVLV